MAYILDIVKNMDIAFYHELDKEHADRLDQSAELAEQEDIERWTSVQIIEWIGLWYNSNFGIVSDRGKIVVDNTGRSVRDWFTHNAPKLISCGYGLDHLMHIDMVVSFLDKMTLRFETMVEEQFLVEKLIEIFGLQGLLCLGI